VYKKNTNKPNQTKKVQRERKRDLGRAWTGHNKCESLTGKERKKG